MNRLELGWGVENPDILGLYWRSHKMAMTPYSSSDLCKTDEKSLSGGGGGVGIGDCLMSIQSINLVALQLSSVQ